MSFYTQIVIHYHLTCEAKKKAYLNEAQVN